MKAKTLQHGSVEEMERALAEVRSGDFAPTLAIVFAGVERVREGVGRVFAEAGLDVVGATTSGEITVGADEDCVYDDSVVAMLLQLEPDAYRARLFDARDGSSAELGREAGRWARATFARPALLVLGSGMRTDGEQLLKGVLEEMGAGTPVFGGLAGDGSRFEETYVFDGRDVCGEGALVLALDQDRVEVRGTAASGWQPLGVEKVVTRSEGNVVHTIDDVPALDLYREYLGLTTVALDSEATIVIGECPLQVARDGYTVLRAAMVADPAARALVFAGSVPQGARVRFSTAPGPEITEEALRAMRRLRDEGAEADALLLFSCAARRWALGPLAADEIRPMQELWDAPLAGFFTYGEIGAVQGNRSDFHNETCVLVALRER